MTTPPAEMIWTLEVRQVDLGQLQHCNQPLLSRAFQSAEADLDAFTQILAALAGYAGELLRHVCEQHGFRALAYLLELCLHSSTIENYLQRCPPKKTLHKLHSGSWIYSNFDIWIGEDEENRAWDLLGETRRFLESKLRSLTPVQREAALHEVYAAEGSDWFWWYGPDFSTECDELFDDLFRQHLKNVYSICGESFPPELNRTVLSAEKPALYLPPRRQITPLINGEFAPFYEWVGAGFYVAGSEQGAMFRDDRFLRTVRFGCDTQRLYLRCDLRRVGDFTLGIVFHQPAGLIVRTPAAAARGTASSGRSAATAPPASASACSRRRWRSINSCEGATPRFPLNMSAGTATPGRSSERANPSASSQPSTYGSVKTSARKPKPGITAEKP